MSPNTIKFILERSAMADRCNAVKAAIYDSDAGTIGSLQDKLISQVEATYLSWLEATKEGYRMKHAEDAELIEFLRKDSPLMEKKS